MTEVQWKRGGMVHIINPTAPPAVLCGANRYANRVFGPEVKRMWDTSPGPDEHRCRKCKTLAAKARRISAQDA